MDCKKCLVIVPHGDDEVLMCGGTIHKLSEQGCEVHVAFVRKPHDQRTTSQLATTKDVKSVLGIKQVHFLNVTEEQAANDFLFLKIKVEDVISLIKPDTIFTTFYGDNHQDHRNLFRAVSVACRSFNAPFVRSVYAGETISSTEQNLGPEKFAPNTYVVLSLLNLDAKLKSIEMYKTERRTFPHPRSVETIRATAIVRGNTINEPYAEAFMCIKDVKY